MESQYKKALEQAIIHTDIIKLFDNLLTFAVEEGSSDIHIEPFENYSRIRIRIDGVLEEIMQYPRSMHESVISKFKIESWQMRPDEKRLPQDARVSTMTLTNKEIDLRASTLPTIRWEKLVMRIVDKSKKIPELKVLGISGSNEEIIMKHLKRPNGIILNTWPTWSGKTSTLYACLQDINRVDVNIVTYEDPVENKLQWLSQSQVRSDIGFTFAAWLRAALRQDPDIIMVWEIRDAETLEMAMEAAMTWHLVLSTVHTNSSAETITRVINLGAKYYMIAGTFNLVMAQRLCRTICPQCKTQHSIANTESHTHAKEAFHNIDQEKLKREIIKRNIKPEQRTTFMNDGIAYYGSWKDTNTGGICTYCWWTGYKGRIGIFELMDYNDLIKDMLIKEKTAFEIEKIALQQGMIDLERDGIFKAIQGIITIEEVYRVVTHRN